MVKHPAAKRPHRLQPKPPFLMGWLPTTGGYFSNYWLWSQRISYSMPAPCYSMPAYDAANAILLFIFSEYVEVPVWQCCSVMITRIHGTNFKDFVYNTKSSHKKTTKWTNVNIIVVVNSELARHALSFSLLASLEICKLRFPGGPPKSSKRCHVSYLGFPTLGNLKIAGEFPMRKITHHQQFHDIERCVRLAGRKSVSHHLILRSAALESAKLA